MGWTDLEGASNEEVEEYDASLADENVEVWERGTTKGYTGPEPCRDVSRTAG